MAERIYFIKGKDPQVKRELLEELSQKVSFNYFVFPKDPVEKIVSAMLSSSLFGEAAGVFADFEAKVGAKELKAIKEALASLPQNNVVVLRFEEIPSQLIEGLECAVLDSTKFSVEEAFRFIKNRCSKYNIKLTEGAIKTLLERIDVNRSALDRELLKLSLLFPGQTIDSTLVEQVVEKERPVYVWGILEKVLAGKISLVLPEYIRLLRQEDSLLVLGAISSQLLELHMFQRGLLEQIHPRLKKMAAVSIPSSVFEIISWARLSLNLTDPWYHPFVMELFLLKLYLAIKRGY